MKKVLSRILAIALTVIFFSTPSAAQAATVQANNTPDPVLIYNSGDLKLYQYTPDPYLLSQGDTLELRDITSGDGRWYVPAGHGVTFNSYVRETESFRMRIANSNSELVYDSGVVSGVNIHAVLPAISTDNYYRIWVTSYSGIRLSGYDAYYYVN